MTTRKPNIQNYPNTRVSKDISRALRSLTGDELVALLLVVMEEIRRPGRSTN